MNWIVTSAYIYNHSVEQTIIPESTELSLKKLMAEMKSIWR